MYVFIDNDFWGNMWLQHPEDVLLRPAVDNVRDNIDLTLGSCLDKGEEVVRGTGGSMVAMDCGEVVPEGVADVSYLICQTG